MANWRSINPRALLNGSGAIMVTRVAGAGFGFLTQFLLVKLMGAKELGLFYTASSLAAVFGVFLALGYPQLAPRFIGRYRNRRSDALTGRFAAQALGDGLETGIIGALLMAAWALFWPGIGGAERAAYAIAALALPAVVGLNVTTNIAGGMRAFTLCYVPEGLWRPILFLAVCALFGAMGLPLSGVATMAVFTVITYAITLWVGRETLRLLPPMRWHALPRGALPMRWRTEAWQLVLTAVFTNFFADVCIAVTAPFLEHDSTAVFGLCLKLALLVGYFVQIGQQMVVPDLADASHAGDEDWLRHATWNSIKLPALLAGLALIGNMLVGQVFLGYFGPAFVEGKETLTLLLAAQLLRALAGPGVHLLTLRGNQSLNIALAGSALVVLCVSAAILCPLYESLGGAVAVLIVQAYWNIATIVALRRLGQPTMDVFWILRHRRRQPQLSPAE